MVRIRLMIIRLNFILIETRLFFTPFLVLPGAVLFTSAFVSGSWLWSWGDTLRFTAEKYILRWMEENRIFCLMVVMSIFILIINILREWVRLLMFYCLTS